MAKEEQCRSHFWTRSPAGTGAAAGAPLRTGLFLLVVICGTAGAHEAAAGQLSRAEKQKLPPAADRQVDYAKAVRPLFAKHCTKCHGTKKQNGGLRLDLHSWALRGGDSGPVIVAGKSGERRLIQLVAGVDPDEFMPPRGTRLTREEVSLLRAWIDQGAEWRDPETGASGLQSDHWSLKPVKKPPAPVVTHRAWVRSPIDSFVAARLEEAGLAPSPQADRAMLIRRLSFEASP